jgi:hypothetical protein
MINPADRVEIITSVQRRRRWTAPEKIGFIAHNKLLISFFRREML